MRAGRRALARPVLAGFAALCWPGWACAWESRRAKGREAPARTDERSAILSADAWAFIDAFCDRHGAPRSEIAGILSAARVQPTIIRAMSVPSTSRPWHQYAPVYLNPERIAGGVRFWGQHAAVLAQAAARFAMDEAHIVATIGVETQYGRVTGTFRVLDALYTLAFAYPRRAAFFREELEQFLLLVRDGQLDWRTVRGSYAGAMGIPQFLPSSLKRYGVDFDEDGRIDFWRSPADAVGSVANYYRAFGWQNGQPVVLRASVTGDGHRALVDAGIKPHLPAGELSRHGVAAAATLAADIEVALIELQAEDGREHWIVFDNFYVITRYNRSTHYAMSLHRLAEEIRAARARGA
jgi:membrane-bound lytic murein transglycosylase B